MRNISIAISSLLLLTVGCRSEVSSVPVTGTKTPEYTMKSVEPSYGYTYHEEMIEGGDGFKLLTRIYLPEGEGPWPVVVTRTPYVWGGRGDNNPTGRAYAQRGIGYIQQDCRGKGGSEGFYSPNIYEREDGTRLYNWLTAQEWCREIGIFGTSYTALTGWIVADNVGEKLKGMYLSHYGVDRHISCFRAGLFREDIMSGWLIDNAEEDIIRPARVPGKAIGENYYDFYLYKPQVEADVDVLGVKLQYYRDWITHTDYNDPYWNTGVWGDLKRIPYEVDVPVTIVAGQFDHHEEGTILAYERLKPEVRKKSRLILGSWNHSFQVTPTHVPTEHAKEFDTSADQFNWFYNLLVMHNEPQNEVKVYAIEKDEWLNLESWPIKPSKKQKVYLTRESNDGVYELSFSGKGKKDVLTYDYDPENPVYAIGGETIFTSQMRRGSRKQNPAGYREDVLSFVSEPLQKDMTIAGEVKLHLTASTDADDTAFAFTMMEVTPEGETYNMRTSITTLGYREGLLEDRVSYKPGSKVKLEVVALPMVWTVKAGNRIRIDVQSSVFPEYAVHTNYAGVWAEQPVSRVAHQNIYVGGASYLELPLI